MFTVNEIIKATKGKLLLGDKRARVKGVSIDSRTIRKGELFVAIRGARYDGHSFIADAANKGAAGVLLHSKSTLSSDALKAEKKSKPFVVSVRDTSGSLGDLALFHRKRFDIPFVAVTGSNGKTTTKEMIGCVLQRGWHPLKNPGTQNNLIGVSSTLLKLKRVHKSAVIELGMNHFGEIKRLTQLARPNIGLVTNIGPAHLEYLNDLKGVYCAKKELLDSLGQGDIAVLNNDDSLLKRYKRRSVRTVTYGIMRRSDFQADGVKRYAGGWRFSVSGKRFFLNSVARHDVYNALASIAVGRLFGVRYEEISGALRHYSALEKRMTRTVRQGIEIIDDTYNSNPLSLIGAVRTLADYKTRGRKTLVSGDMLELGKRAGYYHSKIGRVVAGSRIDNFITIGELARRSFLEAKRYGMKNAWCCSTKEEAVEILRKITRPADVILVKGSRARRMEDVISCFTTSFSR